MATPSRPELLRLSSTSPSLLAYFTDVSCATNTKSDVVLVVEKQKFYCHRLLLSLVSPVFTRMFDGEFKEHTDREIILEGKTSSSILELLKYIYPQFNGQITNENIEDFLQLADEYMIEHLKQPCKDILIKQLDNFKFVELPIKQKIHQPSMKSKNFHASDSALDSSNRGDDDSSGGGAHSSRRPIATLSVRHHSAKPSANHPKTGDKSGSSSNTGQPRYVLFLDQTRMPIFYDGRRTPVPFTTIEIEIWLRRLRILYQIDKGRNYGEIIDSILSILQFIPATLLIPLVHITIATYPTDEMMLNDIARARMHFLEEWACDGEANRAVILTDSYRTMSPSALIAAQQLSTPLAAHITGSEPTPFQATVIGPSDLEAQAPAVIIDSDSDESD